MINKFKKNKNVVSVLFIFIIFLLSYYKAPFIFFQQDDILDFGLFIKEGSRIILSGLGDSEIRHFVPLSRIISYSIYQIFGLNYWIYNLMGLIFHLINGVLVYLLAIRMFKKHFLAVISTIVFFSSSVAAEFIMWPIISLNSISLSFSLVLWLLIIDEKIFSKVQGLLRGVVISLLFLLAIFSVEYSAGLILFIPLAIILASSGGFKKKLIFLSPFIFVVLSYLLLRLIPSLINHESAVIPLVKLNALSVVIRYFGQTFLGQTAILFLSDMVGENIFSLKLDSTSIENIMFPIIAGSVGLLLIAIPIFFYKTLFYKKLNRNFWLCILFIIFSSFPFLLNSEGVGIKYIISSRYLYFGLAGIALYLGFVSELLLKLENKVVSGIVFLVIIFLICYGTWGNIQKANDLYSSGMIRFRILSNIEKLYPSLPSKAIFYTESDKSYYGLLDQEKILPFQSGFGQTLLIFLTQKNKLPKEFYPGRYLWNIDSEGYKSFENRGFGYFRDFNKLVKTLENEKLPIESVISFRYDSDTQILTDNTEEVRGRLIGYFSVKKEISLFETNIFTNLNPEKTSLMFDKKRNTFWDSNLPYTLPQFIQIKLSGLRKISEINIDSGDNRDQNEVGYAVYLSSDGHVWERVFYSKRYPPKEDGIVNLYLLPKFARFVKIQQIGYHKYASWVISELKIYEVKN